jgi:hypothetical protein
MASWHVQTLFEQHLPPISINLIIGMCPTDGISMMSHRGFQDIIRDYNPLPNYSQFMCQYVYRRPEVHSKVYIWLRDDTPISSFVGSANYSQTAFSASRREVLDRCNNEEALEYYGQIERDSIFCNNPDVEGLVTIYREAQRFEFEGFEQHEATHTRDRVVLSLLSDTGETGNRSGLNWGQRPGRDPNQAYIPLPSRIAHSGFFPLDRQHFTVMTDDNIALIFRVEQQNDKAITTPENNSRLGEYFRNRLGLGSGAYVSRADLERYGRTDITFIKFDDEHYFMDFSARP